MNLDLIASKLMRWRLDSINTAWLTGDRNWIYVVDWQPDKNLLQAMMIWKRFQDLGKFTSFSLNKGPKICWCQLQDNFNLTPSILGEGKTEMEAICNAAIIIIEKGLV